MSLKLAPSLTLPIEAVTETIGFLGRRGSGKSYAAANVAANVSYARACVRDCLKRGEAPIASHLLYTQPGILDDANDEERQIGIRAGLSWLLVAEATVVYTDLGVSNGMEQGITAAKALGVSIEYRTLASFNGSR